MAKVTMTKRRGGGTSMKITAGKGEDLRALCQALAGERPMPKCLLQEDNCKAADCPEHGFVPRSAG
jgi:hypothetical protein